MKKILFYFALIIVGSVYAQSIGQHATEPDLFRSYWQQHVDYQMEIDMDVEKFQYKGKQELVYTNNSPDVLKRVYYHLYFNAFKPGSEMDVRSRTIKDPDARVGDRISKLSPNEIGYIKVNSLKQNGKNLTYETVGTVLEVTLNQPIQPGEKVNFSMDFNGQVPKQIRRSGRDNKEGVALSMTQWYPKLAEYDDEGWHADPYIGREFHGVWGDFDVKITIDKDYTIGGTGYLQNPDEIGHGYSDEKVKHKKKVKKLTWHFKAPNVHDFTWAADPDYIHDKIQAENGVTLHFFYKNDKEILENWKKLQPKTAEILAYLNKHVGQYPYKQYSVIHGGDGGMEYAMCTFVAGGGARSNVGTIFHELAHTWFQQILANNESKHPWMDEGFTSYISGLASNKILRGGEGRPTGGRSYGGYFYVVRAGIEQALTTHSDRYDVNTAYSVASYTKGSMFLAQLNYVIGEENVKKTLKKYYNDFSFKHPTPNDIKRTAEKVSGLHLDWYLNEWAQTTNTIDYAIDNVEGKKITLKRVGKMPMPIDVTVTYADGSTEDFNIPLRMMRGNKPTSATVIDDWTWSHPSYTFSVTKDIKKVEIDNSQLMADVDRKNNVYEAK